MPAQFALRVAILGGFALVMFSIIFFRLWYLQVLSGRQVPEAGPEQPGPRRHRSGAQGRDPRPQRATSWSTTAPRWRFSSTRPSCRGPHRRREREFARLGKVIGMSPKAIRKQLHQQTKDVPANPVTLQRDVGYDLVYYLRENQDSYPGVSVQRVYVRNYPDGTLAAQIFGYVREVTEAAAQRAPLPGPDSGRPGRPVRDREHLRQRAARDERRRRGSRSTPRASPPAGC